MNRYEEIKQKLIFHDYKLTYESKEKDYCELRKSFYKNFGINFTPFVGRHGQAQVGRRIVLQKNSIEFFPEMKGGPGLSASAETQGAGNNIYYDGKSRKIKY